MSSTNQIQSLIAHYLATNYPSVLEPFLQASHIPAPDPSQPPNPDLRTLVEDWASQQLVNNLDAVVIEDEEMAPVDDGSWRGWTTKDVMKLTLKEDVKLSGAKRSLEGISASNLLTVGQAKVPKREFVTSTASLSIGRGRADTATPSSSNLGVRSASYEPSLSPHRIDGRDNRTHRPGHRSTITNLHIVQIRHLRYTEVHRIKVDSNPEAILFHPESSWLMYTTRSSHLLTYVRLPSSSTEGQWQVKTKSFNPHPMDNHVSFAVLNLALHPSGRVIACQTGDHRGGAGERILIYGVEPEETERLACLWTGSEGDDFVLPRMAWLPDGSALITTTPNGYLNLISLSGETRSSVKIHGAQDLGQASSEVVRDCYVVSTDDGDWEVLSVGYDRQIRISR
ncbi:hypothetical protein CI109_104233 [Kwoniella shandongensis]|uniref:LisH domain-containing protein n=1 Tax=Kwoniella shandongensis TaxID=1734106 RepID=A0AAJ8LME2_9TREE